MDERQAANRVLESIKTYSKVLQFLSTQDLSACNKTVLTQALHWAMYCCKLADKLMSHSFQSMRLCIEGKMTEMNVSMKLMPQTFDLQFLLNGPNTLIELLLFNPTLQDAWIQAWMQFLREHNQEVKIKNPSHWQNPARIKTIRKCFSKVCKAVCILEHQLKEKFGAEAEPEADTEKEIVIGTDLENSMRCLFEELVMLKLASMKSGWYEFRMLRIIHQVIQSPSGLTVMVSCLSQALCTRWLKEKGRQEVLQDVISTIIWCLTGYYKSLLLEVAPETLARLAETNGHFADWYLEELEASIDQIDQHQLSTTSHESQLNSLANRIPIISTLTKPLEALECLLTKDSELKSKVLAMLYLRNKQACSGPDQQIFSVWIDLTTQLIDYLQ